MKQVVLLILVIALFTTSSCRKKNVFDLPAATSTGANTFGCILNGIKYTASGKWPSGVGMIYPDTGVEYYFFGSEMTINAHTRNSNKERKNITLKFTNSGSLYITDFMINGANVLPNSGSFIKLTRNDNVLSGTFEGHVPDGASTWDITDGRFDISLN